MNPAHPRRVVAPSEAGRTPGGPRLVGGALVLAAAALAAGGAWAAPAQGGAPDVDALIKRYDDVMSPAYFDAEARMIAHRSDGSVRSYKMRVQKSGTDKVRVTFLAPAAAKGQEMLRSGDNQWLYMPNLKRAVRIASRDQFMGGDFNNADVLRVNYEADYDVTLGKSDKPGQLVLELKAKSPSVAYDRIKLWMTDAKESQPVRAELYASSGKLLRAADFSDVKTLSKGWTRPTKITMRNLLEPKRFSEMIWDAGEVKESIPSQRFVLDDLGR